jgi:hypothetical protein
MEGAVKVRIYQVCILSSAFSTSPPSNDTAVIATTTTNAEPDEISFIQLPNNVFAVIKWFNASGFVLCKICSLLLVTVKATVLWDVLLCNTISEETSVFIFKVEEARSKGSCTELKYPKSSSLLVSTFLMDLLKLFLIYKHLFFYSPDQNFKFAIT